MGTNIYIYTTTKFFFQITLTYVEDLPLDITEYEGKLQPDDSINWLCMVKRVFKFFFFLKKSAK